LWQSPTKSPQSTVPGGQAHVPELQTSLPGQMFPHVPQFLVSFERSTQVPLQLVRSEPQPQTPAPQGWPAPQA
jgi:hypothetical protein